MGPESVKSQDTLPSDCEAKQAPAAAEPKLDRPEIDELNWVFFGPNGLRSGWSILLFGVLLYFLLDLFQVILSFLVRESDRDAE